MFHISIYEGFPGSSSGKEPTYQCRRCKRCSFDPWVRKVRKSLWRRIWQPIPVFFPGKSHGQSSLEGYSPWGRKELNMTEHVHTQLNNTICILPYVYYCTIYTSINTAKGRLKEKIKRRKIMLIYSYGSGAWINR